MSPTLLIVLTNGFIAHCCASDFASIASKGFVVGLLARMRLESNMVKRNHRVLLQAYAATYGEDKNANI
jgi:hypothetical protein